MTQVKSPFFRIIRIIAKPKIIFALVAAFLAVAGFFYVKNIWDVNLSQTETAAIRTALSAEGLLSSTAVGKLTATPEDIDTAEYRQIKESLADLVAYDQNVRFAYLYTKKDGKIYFMVDSEPADSADYSPPGQEYTDAVDATFQPFEDGQPLLTQPVTDSWGTWVSALVPVKDADTDEVIAVFGLDFPADKWYDVAFRETLLAAAVILVQVGILFSFYLVLSQKGRMKAEKEKLMLVTDKLEEEKAKLLVTSGKLRESEVLFRTIYEKSSVGIAIGSNELSVVDTNAMYEKIVGRKTDETKALGWKKYTHPDDVEQEIACFESIMRGESDYQHIVKRYVKPDGSIVWADVAIVPLALSGEDKNHFICQVVDITEKVHAEEELRESERSKSVMLYNLPGMAYRCDVDRNWTMRFVSGGCLNLTGYTPESLISNKDVSFNDLIMPECREDVWAEGMTALTNKRDFNCEYQIRTAAGVVKWVYDQAQIIYDENGNATALEGLIIDITERKKRENEVQYLSMHDTLTGVYNRWYFRQEKKRLDVESSLPLSVIIGDINGLRLINDAFGHLVGDKYIIETANILRSCCRETDILARVGGAEFIILMPNTDSDTAYETMKSIKAACEAGAHSLVGEVSTISISLGYSTKTVADVDIDLVMKDAEDYMYKRKLLEQKSSHSAILASIKATMLERSQETEEHEERLTEMAVRLGKALNIPQSMLDELALLAMLHDIGKVAIDDMILKKPGRLNEEEWDAMKLHPAIGFRIAMATTKLVPIADIILCHHERWDGTGYPQGLAGENIPLLSRIISVVDAYDAMTQDRPYRKAISEQDALEEIARNAGTQFDPMIAKTFIRIMLHRNE